MDEEKHLVLRALAPALALIAAIVAMVADEKDELVVGKDFGNGF